MIGYALLYGVIIVVSLASWIGNMWSHPTLLSARERLIKRNPYLAELNWDRASEKTATRLVGVRAAVSRPVRATSRNGDVGSAGQRGDAGRTAN